MQQENCAFKYKELNLREYKRLVKNYSLLILGYLVYVFLMNFGTNFDNLLKIENILRFWTFIGIITGPFVILAIIESIAIAIFLRAGFIYSIRGIFFYIVNSFNEKLTEWFVAKNLNFVKTVSIPKGAETFYGTNNAYTPGYAISNSLYVEGIRIGFSDRVVKFIRWNK